MEKDNKKFITLAFVASGFLIAIIVNVLLETAAAAFGTVARYYGQDWVRHGIPVVSGLATFFFFQFNKKIVAWGDEVLVELRKVVWPTRKDTTAMTIVCCVMLIIASVLLGLLDMLSRNIIQMIIN